MTQLLLNLTRLAGLFTLYEPIVVLRVSVVFCLCAKFVVAPPYVHEVICVPYLAAFKNHGIIGKQLLLKAT